jgi:hypothetical protein
MRLTQSLIPPWETAQVLLESPGVIRQTDLAEFVRLREDLLDGQEVGAEFREMHDSLNARFEAGFLIEMGASPCSVTIPGFSSSLMNSRRGNGTEVIRRGLSRAGFFSF